MKRAVAIWVCSECGDVVVSKDWERHTMDYCKCKKTAVDLEEHYARILGKQPSFYKLVKIKEAKKQ